MSFDLEQLYALLPAIYRLRDAALAAPGEEPPLRALMSVFAEQVSVLQEDLAQLYDDQFIETCADWVVPYIGDLIGYRALYGLPRGKISASSLRLATPRAEVADTIAFRRRKGTAAALEQLARDVTGWPARIVEFFNLLCTTQYLNHLRPANLQCPDLRDVNRLQSIGTAFETVNHSLDVRNIATRQGRYNIPNIGIFLWRLGAYPLTDSTAPLTKGGWYTFDPLGMDVPLFGPGRAIADFAHLSLPSDVVAPLRRRPLYGELEGRRQALAGGAPPVDVEAAALYFGKSPVLSISIATGPADLLPKAIDPVQIQICDLSELQAPASPISVAVDPELGRMAFAAGTVPAGAEVRVQWTYGFSADLGGGEYSRLRDDPDPKPLTQPIGRGVKISTAFPAPAGAGPYLVLIDNSSTYAEDITLSPAIGQQITLRAKNGSRSVLAGSVTINAADSAVVTIDGLLIAGQIKVIDTRPPPAPGKALPMTVSLMDCTLAPWLELDASGAPKPLAHPSIDWSTGGEGLLILNHCIGGTLRLSPKIRAQISDCIIDALADDAVAIAVNDAGGAAGVLNIARSTVVGRVHFREIELAEDSIFTGTLTSERRQSGCVRFSYVAADSQTPRRYRCQPDLAVKSARDHEPAADDARLAQIQSEQQSRVRPVFTDDRYGRPAYMQLHRSCPTEIQTGSSEESEMGAFCMLFQARRLSNLAARMEEYLRFGLEAGVFLVT